MSSSELPPEWVNDPALSEFENSLWAALRRLERGTPTNADLVVAASEGRLRISITTVAAEAGCSRTPIGTEGCDYPNVRKAILERKKVTGSSLRQEIARLRARVAELETRLAARDSTSGELILRMRALSKGRTPSGAPLAKRDVKSRRNALRVVEGTSDSLES